MIWMEVVKKDMKLLELEERMWLIEMIGGVESMYWSEYKLFFSVLVHIVDSKLLGLRLVGLVWFVEFLWPSLLFNLINNLLYDLLI